MGEERIRAAFHAAADDCFSGVKNMPSQKWAVLERVEAKQSRRYGKRALAPALAFLLTLAIAGAMAVGLGLFGTLRSGLEQEMNYSRLGLLEEAAVTVGQTTEIGELGELTIDQAYCDGNRLYYSYTMRKNEAETSLFLGDGAELEDGTQLTPVDSWIEETDDLTTAAFYEVALPEGFAPGAHVRILLTTIHMQQDGAPELIDVPVLIPVTPARRLAGKGAADGYKAMAEIYVSDVDVYGEVRIFAPEEYSPEGYDLQVDGKMYQNIGWGFGYDGEAHRISLRFDFPESLEDMKLIPVDSDDAQEAIALHMTEGGAQ